MRNQQYPKLNYLPKDPKRMICHQILDASNHHTVHRIHLTLSDQFLCCTIQLYILILFQTYFGQFSKQAHHMCLLSFFKIGPDVPNHECNRGTFSIILPH